MQAKIKKLNGKNIQKKMNKFGKNIQTQQLRLRGNTNYVKINNKNQIILFISIHRKSVCHPLLKKCLSSFMKNPNQDNNETSTHSLENGIYKVD